MVGKEEDAQQLAAWRAAAGEGEATLEALKEALLSLNRILCGMAAAEAEAAAEVRTEPGEWRTAGHEWIGKRLRRPAAWRGGHACGFLNATVVGWLPAAESDFLDENLAPAALWHVLRDDGEEEDLEEMEVRWVCVPDARLH